MKTTTKIWLGIGATASIAVAAVGQRATDVGLSPLLSAAAAATPTAEPSNLNDFNGDLGEALKKIFAGEGGEGGIGLGPMWPSVRAPALTGPQLRMVITGNTLRNDHRTALYYDPSGKLEGWVTSFAAVPSADVERVCDAPALASMKYHRSGNKCWALINNPVRGSWQINGHQLCVDSTAAGKREEQCWYVALLLDRVALFDQNGQLNKLGRVLKHGKVLDAAAD